jgi:lactoylglutathione lyase
MSPIDGTLAHVGIRVAELARSRAFFEKLGFRLVAGPIGPEPVAILTNDAGTELNLIINANRTGNVLMDDKAARSPGYTHIALTCSDLEQTIEHLQATGIALSGGPITFPHGARAVFVRDPDGNVVELHEPAPVSESRVPA